MTYVWYWPAGANSVKRQLPMTADEISEHLLSDWLPNTAITKAASLIGWPKELVLTLGSGILPGELYLHERAGYMERQWKSVLSWMLGVAGARHALADEGYRWIAPTSAFYEEKDLDVNYQAKDAPFVAQWLQVAARQSAAAGTSTSTGQNNVASPQVAQSVATSSGTQPQSNVTGTSGAQKKVNERPDFIAARPLPSQNGCQLAIAESKGTNAQLETMIACDPTWYQQAHNAVVTRLDTGNPVPIPRHFVIATRVNPNAKKESTRALQIRAWNSNEGERPTELPAFALLDIVGAHLTGLYRNLELDEVADVVRRSLFAYSRREAFSELPRPTLDERDAAQRQLRSLREESRSEQKARKRVRVKTLSTDRVDIDAELDDPIVELTERFIRGEDPTRILAGVRDADARLDEISFEDRTLRSDRGKAWTSAGVKVRARTK